MLRFDGISVTLTASGMRITVFRAQRRNAHAVRALLQQPAFQEGRQFFGGNLRACVIHRTVYQRMELVHRVEGSVARSEHQGVIEGCARLKESGRVSKRLVRRFPFGMTGVVFAIACAPGFESPA